MSQKLISPVSHLLFTGLAFNLLVNFLKLVLITCMACILSLVESTNLKVPQNNPLKDQSTDALMPLAILRRSN